MTAEVGAVSKRAVQMGFCITWLQAHGLSVKLEEQIYVPVAIDILTSAPPVAVNDTVFAPGGTAMLTAAGIRKQTRENGTFRSKCRISGALEIPIVMCR